MKQFAYRPPSAGRSLLRNSKDEDPEKEESNEDDLNEQKLASLRMIISAMVRDYIS